MRGVGHAFLFHYSGRDAQVAAAAESTVFTVFAADTAIPVGAQHEHQQSSSSVVAFLIA